MIAAWMLFATTLGVLLALAAAAAEHIVAWLGWRRRIVWLAAVAATVIWPAVYAVRELLRPADATVSSALLPISRVTARVHQANDAIARVSAFAGAHADAVLLGLWVAASVLFLARIALAVRSLALRRRTWREAVVDGMAVRLATDIGPAVVGIREPEVVLPEWIVALDTPLRALVLRHEDEHRRAGDSMLMLLSAIAVAVMPWNLALRWQARRLALAMEMDCDARVLDAHPQQQRYGLLLLTIAQRRAAARVALAPALSEPASHLERRIMAMQKAARSMSRTRVLAFGALAVAAVAVACAVDAPSAARERNAASRASAKPFVEFKLTKEAALLPGSPAPRYPDLLREADVQGQVLAQFVVKPDGKADVSTFKVVRSDHELFTSAVKAALPMMRFTPAEAGGRTVRQLVTMPFMFSLARR